MEGQWPFSSKAFSWRSRDRNPKEKENKQTHGGFRKSFGKSWRFKRSNDNAASSLDPSDCPKSESQRVSFSASKPPCQAFGSTQSQVYPQDNVSSLNKPGLVSSSAQQHGERRRVADERRLSDVGAWTEKDDKFDKVPSGMYKKLHMLSRSARHPEMDYSFSNININKASKDSNKGDLQVQDIGLLEEPTKVDCTEFQKHNTNVLKVSTNDSGNTEASHNLHLASKHCDLKSFVSHPAASSQAAFKDGKGIACNSSGKSGNIKSSQKFVKSSRHVLLSHSVDWTAENDKFSEVPSGMYKRLHMLSRSAGHPEMDCSFSNINFPKASKDSIKGDLQMHDICSLEEPIKVDCTELQKHDINDIKVSNDSGNTEASHNLHLSSKHCDLKSFVSHPAASSQAVSKDGKGIACISFGKSGNIKSSQKFVKSSKHVLLSHSVDWTEKNDKFSEVPSGMYKRLHMLSRSARHPEMDCSFSNINFHKASKDSIKCDLQMHDIFPLEEPKKVDCAELQKHDTNVIKVPKDSGNTEAFHNLHLASKNCNWKSFVSHPEASSQAVSKDGKCIACNSSGKSGNIKSSQKFGKSSKRVLLSHSADEARSRAVALHRWFKHIIKRKGSQNLKNGEKERYHSDDLDQSMCMNAGLENDILQRRILEDKGPNSSGLHLMAASLVRKSKTNKAYFDVPHSWSQLQRSSSLPHSESYYMYQNIHSDMPRRSEASAGNLRRYSIIGSEELEALESEEVLFPQRRHRESIHKKSVFPDNPATVPVHDMAKSMVNKFDSGADNIDYLNNFLKRQRMKLSNVPPGDDSARVKIILSGSDLSLSSMMAAIGYAWLLEHLATQQAWNPVPVINTTRQKMWEHREAAWLFYHSGLDAQSLLFCDEVDLESLVHARQLSMVVIGQDALKTEDEVASLCTILVEEYKEHAYELLQLPYIRKILLAGILIDTQNLDSTAVYFTTRDRVAVDLLLVGCSQYYRYILFDELNQSHSDSSFEEAMRDIYGEPSLNSEVGKGDEEDESLSQKFDTDSKNLVASSKTDVTGALQHEDGSRCSNANLFVDPVFHPETSLAKSDVSQLSSLSLSGRNAKINWMVAKWFGFGFGSRQSVET